MINFLDFLLQRCSVKLIKNNKLEKFIENRYEITFKAHTKTHTQLELSVLENK